ncbi:hypothetical protein ACLOJK_017771 [Asimina triloba]
MALENKKAEQEPEPVIITPSSTYINPSQVRFLLADIASVPGYRFIQWLELVRKRTSQYRSSGFPNHPVRQPTMPLRSISCSQERYRRIPWRLSASIAEDSIFEAIYSEPCEPATETSLWERLGKAAMLDIDSSEFSWYTLSSLHHTEHSSSTEQSEDETNRAIEVTVNSGGVVFFAMFNRLENNELLPLEAAAVIKVSSTRMTTQSERLGYEFAKWLGVRTPQARVIHHCSPEWQQIKDAAEKARDTAIMEGDEGSQLTCSELLEALEMSRYVHGSPLLESWNAFDSQEAAEHTASALGRILLLDLVLRNEDRLPCRELGWRGNSANLLFAEKIACVEMDALGETFDSVLRRYQPSAIRALQKDRRSISVEGRLSPSNPELVSQSSMSSLLDTPTSSQTSKKTEDPESKSCSFHIVVIDSGVPRRPPAGKRANDQAHYPKLVELLLNSAGYSSNLLFEITCGKMGIPVEVSVQADPCPLDMASIVHEFRAGFRAALRDLQGFHLFLLTLYQKLDSLLRACLLIMNRSSYGDIDKEEVVVSEPSASGLGVNCSSLASKGRPVGDAQLDLNDPELQKAASKSSSSGSRESSDSASPVSRESWHGKYYRGGGEPHRSLRLTMKLRDFNKYAKVQNILSKFG